MTQPSSSPSNTSMRHSGSSLGTAITRWHNVELPDVRSGRVDLLGETETGQLIHIELQSSNDAKMAQRMLQYYVDVERLLDRHPSQVLLYVGDAPAKMETTLRGPSLQYSYRLVDVRDLDGERLLKSPVVDDNIVGLLDTSEVTRHTGSGPPLFCDIHHDRSLRQAVVCENFVPLWRYRTERSRYRPVSDSESPSGPFSKEPPPLGFGRPRTGRHRAKRRVASCPLAESSGTPEPTSAPLQWEARPAELDHTIAEAL